MGNLPKISLKVKLYTNILSTNLEHSKVIETFQLLERQQMFRTIWKQENFKFLLNPGQVA
jgi:hypothetical protein